MSLEIEATRVNSPSDSPAYMLHITMLDAVSQPVRTSSKFIPLDTYTNDPLIMLGVIRRVLRTEWADVHVSKLIQLHVTELRIFITLETE